MLKCLHLESSFLYFVYFTWWYILLGLERSNSHKALSEPLIGQCPLISCNKMINLKLNKICKTHQNCVISSVIFNFKLKTFFEHWTIDIDVQVCIEIWNFKESLTQSINCFSNTLLFIIILSIRCRKIYVTTNNRKYIAVQKTYNTIYLNIIVALSVNTCLYEWYEVKGFPKIMLVFFNPKGCFIYVTLSFFLNAEGEGLNIKVVLIQWNSYHY